MEEEELNNQSNKELADFSAIDPNYSITSLLGTGAFGHVYGGIHKPSGMKVAIKQITRVFDDYLDCIRILREIQMLRHLNHPNIIKLIEIIPPRNIEKFNEIYLVLEYLPVDLRSVFESSLKFNSSIIKKIMYQILNGVKYLHSSYVVHRDLKPENILINENCDIKICDFDLSRNIRHISKSISPICLPEEELNIINYEQSFIPPSILIASNLTSVKGTSNDKNHLKSYTHNGFSVNDLNDEERIINKAEEISKIFYRDAERVKRSFPGSELKEEVEKKKLIRHKHAEKVSYMKKVQISHKRRLSQHVYTRWYRAPEIILLDQDYSFSSDIWSLGCIYAELLQMKSDENRSPIFLGKYCNPLSPSTFQTKSNTNDKDKDNDIKNEDQLNVITQILGPFSSDDLSFVNDKSEIKYNSNSENKKLREFVEDATFEEYQLLKCMLEFNPFFRVNADECLKLKYFRDTADKFSAEHSVNNSIKLKIDYEKNITMTFIKDEFKKEIEHYINLRKENRIYPF